jgi:hypothetical protein
LAFAVPFLIGWFASAGVTPHYSASDQDWTNWAHDSKWNGRISGFAMLVAAFLFLHYLGRSERYSGGRNPPLAALHNSRVSPSPVPSPVSRACPWRSS